MNRERRGVWVSRYQSKRELLDESGRHTGEWVVARSRPFMVTCTVSPCGGNVYADGFGLGTTYDRTMIVCSIDPIVTEDSVMWVDVKPELDEDGELVLDENGSPTVPWDYTVSQIAVSYNYTNIALRKAE